MEWKPFNDGNGAYLHYPKEPCCVYLKQADGTILEGVYDWKWRKDGRELHFLHEGWLVFWNSGDRRIVEWAYREAPPRVEPVGIEGIDPWM